MATIKDLGDVSVGSAKCSSNINIPIPLGTEMLNIAFLGRKLIYPAIKSLRTFSG